METKLDVSFFNELLRCCIVKKSFYLIVKKHLEKTFLPEGSYREIWSELNLYYKKNEKLPSFGVIRQRFADKGLDDALELLADIKDIIKVDYDSVLKEFEDFIKKSKFLKSYSDIAEIYNKGNKQLAYDKFKQSADDLNSFSLKAEEGELLFSGFTKRHSERIMNSKTNYLTENTFPSGIDLLDYFMDGGSKRGEATLFLGDSGVGKSQLGIFKGISVSRRGGRVVHIQGEGTKIQTMDRYDSAWSGTLYKDMKRANLPEGKVKALQNILRKVGKGEIHIFCKDKFGAWTIPDIRNIIAEVIKVYGSVECVIMDYLELFEPGDGIIYRPSDERFRQQVLGRSLKDIAVEFNTDVTTFTQASAIPPEAKENPDFVLTRWNLSEDKGKLRPFDNFITINQTRDEKHEQIIRLYCDKLRENASGQIIKIAQNLSRARFYDRMRTVNEIYTSDELKMLGI